MANLIEIVARWNDQGAVAGTRRMSESVTVLANAIGLGAGFGLIGTVHGLTRALVTLEAAPYKAASGFAQMTREGKNAIQVFKDLAAAQDKTKESWNKFMEEVARRAAPQATLFERIANAAAKAAKVIFEISGGNTGGIPTDSGIGVTARAPRTSTRGGPFAFRGPSADWSTVTARMIKDAQDMADALTKIAKAEAPAEIALRSFTEISAEMSDVLTTGVAAIEDASAQLFANFVTQTQSMGQALLSFFKSIVASILAEIGRLLAHRLILAALKFAGLALGPSGVVVSAGTAAIGPSRAGVGRSGGTIIFQGINTRDMYMQTVRGGSIARANDLVQMRRALA